MKRRLSIFKWVFGLTIFTSMLIAYTSAFDADKTISRSFNVSPSSDLNLDNEYGDVTINTWNKNEVEITVEIRALSGIKSYAKKFVKETLIDFDQKDNKIYAKTILGPRKSTNKWLSWLTGNQTYEVNYFVFIPEMINLSIENEHGDITIDQYDGDLELDLSYGDVHAGLISGAADLKIMHGEADIEGLGNGIVELSFSEFKIHKAGNLELKTTDSEVYIPEALNLTIFSKYDQYNIGSMDNFVNEGAYDEFEIIKARSININTRYTDMSVGVCEIDLEIEMTHGGSTIQHISSAFDGGSIEGNNTDFELTFDGSVNIDLVAEHSDIELNKELTKRSDLNEKNIRSILAFKGEEDNAKTLKIRMKKGSIEMN